MLNINAFRPVVHVKKIYKLFLIYVYTKLCPPGAGPNITPGTLTYFDQTT